MEEVLSLKDIYQSMNIFLENNNYAHSDSYTKKQTLEIGLKKYLIKKIIENNDTIIIDESMEIYQLLDILSLLSGLKKEENMYHLINYLLITMSNEQRFVIKWDIQDNSRYINQPNLIYNDYLLTKIITSKSCNLSSVFNFLNNYYVNDFNNQRVR